MDGWIRIGTELETKSFDSQINELEKKLDVMVNTLESDSKVDVSVKMSKDEKAKLESDIEKIKNKIISLRQEKAKLENGGINLKEMKDGFEGLVNSAKKLVGGIIGIRAAYSLVRKASSAWLSSDDKLTSQMEANWIGLGAIFSDIIETVVKGIKKLVTAVLYFMQILTGTNYIAKANAALLKKQTKETNNLAKANDKLTTSFDELNVLQDNSSTGTSIGGGVDTDALFDINNLSENARTAIEKIATALKPVYGMIKKIIKWAIENPNVIIGILGGAALLSMLGKIIGYAGVGTTLGSGLAGVLGVLLAIASIGTIVIEIKTITDSLKEAQKSTKIANKMTDSVAKSSKKLAGEMQNLAKEGKLTENQVKVLSEQMKSQTDESLRLSRSYKKQKDDLGLLEYAVYKATGEYDGMTKAELANIEMSYDNLKSWQALYEQGLLNDKEIKDYKESLKYFIGTLDNVGTSTFQLTTEFGINKEEAEELQKKYRFAKDELAKLGGQADISKEQIGSMGGRASTTKEQLGKMSDQSDTAKSSISKLADAINKVKTNVDIKVNADTSNARSKLNSFFSGLSGFTLGIGSIIAGNIPRLAVGGIVNNPGRGVPIGGAIAGEAGREGVIPLTDSRAMSELGQEIARYVNIKNFVDVNMDSRKINRITEESSNRQAVLRNG